jgi:trehalose-phosphatase
MFPAGVLLAADFDGTIAPIVAAPADAFIDPAAERFLERCASLPSVAVAIISGRDVDDVRRRIGGLRAIVAGSHGLECVDSAGLPVWTTDQPFPDLPSSMVRDLLRCDIRIERKKFSVAIHFRGSAAAAPDIRQASSVVTGWAEEHNLDVISGRQVVEIRVRGGGKRAALRAIAGRLGARRIIFAGDDITDFPALAFAAANGRAIFVESAERTPPDIPGLWRVSGVEDLCSALTRQLLEDVPETAHVLGVGDRPAPIPPSAAARPRRPSP